LVRGNGHRILISDIQLLQWYSKRRDIRRNPLPYQHTKDSIMNLLADRETTAAYDDSTQLLVTPATDEDDNDNPATTSPRTTHFDRHRNNTAKPSTHKASPGKNTNTNPILPPAKPNNAHQDNILQATRHPERHSGHTTNHGYRHPTPTHLPNRQ